MSIKVNLKHCCALSVVSLVIFSVSVKANSWLDAGDMKLRHELQLLSDAGILDAPITTWPLVSKDIYRSLERSKNINSKQQAELIEVLESVNQNLLKGSEVSSFNLKIGANSKQLLIRDFSGEGRDKTLVSYDSGWNNSLGDVRLKVTIADKSGHPNDQNFRLDESYASSSLGNWKFTVGKQSRWWGPGWDGSLILSNNTRPIPSLSLENISSKAFDNKFLHWLGPLKLHMFVGQLESDRVVPDAKLIGTRFTFKPFNSLEVGLHRTIQWGGSGQNNSIKSFIDAVTGTRSDGSLSTVNGNQIAGYDVRWKLPLGNKVKYSLYGQYIAEDKKFDSFVLGKGDYMFGGSASGYSQKLKGSWRTYAETAGTVASSVQLPSHNNVIYNHSTYGDGYRHLGLSMGHGIDSDSEIISIGAMLSRNNGDFWRGWIKHAELNLDGVGKNPIAGASGKKWSAIGVSLDKKLNRQSKLNLGLQFTSEKEAGISRHDNFGVSVGYSRSL